MQKELVFIAALSVAASVPTLALSAWNRVIGNEDAAVQTLTSKQARSMRLDAAPQRSLRRMIRSTLEYWRDSTGHGPRSAATYLEV
jgi:hypothetical protein